ncbi:MAG TPA: hypothetical protein ENJ88_05970 [Phaeodactylibacter sp.]|nr:hypothetical protein [Phaeodactylibacter sp.]
MKSASTYRPIFRGILYLFLIAQLALHISAYSTGDEHALDLCPFECIDAETEKAKDDCGEEFQLSLLNFKAESEARAESIFCSEHFISPHHPETATPPPESLQS